MAKKKQEYDSIVLTQTKYKKTYCKRLVFHMKSKGRSFKSFGAMVNVSYSTLKNWVKKYPEFKEARELGEVYSLEFWENYGMLGTLGRLVYAAEEEVLSDGTVKRKMKKASFNAYSYQFMMGNLHKWRKNDPETQTDELSTDLLGALEALEAEELGNEKQGKKTTKKPVETNKKLKKPIETNKKLAKSTNKKASKKVKA